MLFKTALLLGLLAGCYAAPIRVSTPGAEVLERRVPGHIPTSVNCGGASFSRQQIEAALHAASTSGRSDKGKEYPAEHKNSEKLFKDPAVTRLVPLCSICGINQFITNAYTLIINSHFYSAVEAKKVKEQPLGLTTTWTGTPIAQYKPMVIAN